MILFLMALTLIAFYEKPSKHILADGLGYYEYLPSIFIHHDFVRKDAAKSDTALYARVSALGDRIYTSYEEKLVTKYPAGTALMISPFFGLAYLYAEFFLPQSDFTGYELVFQNFMLLASAFYLFLALVLFRRFLESFKMKSRTIVWTQVLMLFATSLVHYVYNFPTYSHVYSLFLISGYLLFLRRFFLHQRSKDFLYTALIFAFILLVRQANAIVLLLIPFLAGSLQNMIFSISGILRKPFILLFAILIVMAALTIQSLTYFLQTGHIWVYSYQGEGFNFFDPQFINIMFSYKKGLFIYTPVLLLAAPGLMLMFKEKLFFLAKSWLFFSLFLIYFLSSWWAWSFGGSFGHRAFIDFYPVLFFPIAFLFDKAKSILRIFAFLFAIATIPVLLIQLYQYQTYIITKDTMDAQKYWKVFLKTDGKYKGLLWKKTYNMDGFTTDTTYIIGDKTAEAGKYREIFVGDWMPKDESNEYILRLSFENNFIEENDVRILIEIKNNEGKNIYYSLKPLIHFANDQFGKYQTGFCDYKILMKQKSNRNELRVFFKGLDEEITIRNTKLEIKTQQ